MSDPLSLSASEETPPMGHASQKRLQPLRWTGYQANAVKANMKEKGTMPLPDAFQGPGAHKIHLQSNLWPLSPPTLILGLATR